MGWVTSDPACGHFETQPVDKGGRVAEDLSRFVEGQAESKQKGFFLKGLPSVVGGGGT